MAKPEEYPIRARDSFSLYYHHTEKIFPVIPPFHPHLTSFRSYLSIWTDIVKNLVPSNCQSSFWTFLPHQDSFQPPSSAFFTTTSLQALLHSSCSSSSLFATHCRPLQGTIGRYTSPYPCYSSVHLTVTPDLLTPFFPWVSDLAACLLARWIIQSFLASTVFVHNIIWLLWSKKPSSSLRILMRSRFPSFTLVTKWLQYMGNLRSCRNRWGSLSPPECCASSLSPPPSLPSSTPE